MEFRLGLDIGIASVGWGIVDQNDNIIDAGVRLFPEGGGKRNAADRRGKRCARRLLRRRMHRLERVRKLLYSNNIIDNIEYDFYINNVTPYELRVKGLKEELSNRELAIVLLNLAKRRGIHDFEIKIGKKESEEEKGTKDILINNDKLLEDGTYVCEIQLEKIRNGKENLSLINEKNGVVRGIRNVFRTEDYKKEALAIIETQIKYNNKITNEFREEYIAILEGRREYYIGPGKYIEGIGNISPYGWKNEEEWMENLFGKCTYYPEEIRIPKNSYTAELFNLLNDLNNLTLKREGDEKLTVEEKKKIIQEAKGIKSGISLKTISKLIKTKEDDILGYRIDKNGKAQFSSLLSFIEITNCIPQLKENDDRNKIDEVSKILTMYQSQDKIQENLKKIFGNIELNGLENLSYVGSHSLSKKAINIILDELLNTSKNQMELYTEKGLVPYRMDFKGKKELPKKYVEEWILSPVVKRSLSQSINVINEVHKNYGIPTEIVIEMAREKNSDDKKKIIQELQKNNEKTNRAVNEYIQGKDVNWGKGVFEKIKFWIAQDGYCIYSGKYIPIEILLKYPNNYEIDHIIPRSISFDDSQNNKVLVDRNENQEKGNTTPYHYLSIKGKYDEFKARVLKMNISKTKKEYLLFEGELDKYAIKFIARNLVDTRYATRELLIMLKKYYSDNEKDVKIKSVRGSVTSQIRKMWDIRKEREICHNHHAIDALVMLQGEKILNNLPYVKEFNKKDKSEGSLDIRTGEILDDEAYRKLFKHEYGEKIKNYDKWRYSHYVDKKPNRQLTDETIYSTRLVTEKIIKGKKEVEEVNEYVISKLSGIYDKTNKKIKEFFSDVKKQKQLLMYHNDYKTFEKFMEIYEHYSKEVNPFFTYYNEQKKYITKYAKKENGPPVFDIKYRVQQLGSHLDLSHKYKLKEIEGKDRKKVVMLSIPSLRADFYKKGENYKFVSVTYLMMQDKGKYYELNSKEYEVQKCKKEIDESYEFVFSLYTGDIFEYETSETKEKVKFKGINNDGRNCIEVDFIDRNYGNYIDGIKELQKKLKEEPNIDLTERLNLITGKRYSPIESKKIIKDIPISSKQKIVTVGKALKSIRKIYVNNLGVEYDSKEKFVIRIQK